MKKFTLALLSVFMLGITQLVAQHSVSYTSEYISQCSPGEVLLINTSVIDTGYSNPVIYDWTIYGYYDTIHITRNKIDTVHLTNMPSDYYYVYLDANGVDSTYIGSYSNSVDIYSELYVSYYESGSVFCEPGELHFINQTDTTYYTCYNGTYNFKWFIDGNLVATTTHLDHTGLSGGDHSVRLEAYDSTNMFLGYYEDYVFITPSAQNIHLSTGDKACPGEDIVFSLPVPDEEIYSIEWIIGDSASSDYDYHPNRKFYNQGFVPVTVYVEYYSCGYDTIQQNIEITENAIPKPKINAPMYACPGDMMHFSTDGQYTFYEWDFGGGNIMNAPEADFTFASTGTYPVILKVKNACGNLGSDTVMVNITDSLNNELYVDFNWWWDGEDCQNTPVQFYSQSSSGMHKWYFGDGDSAMGREPVHIFASPGEYNVTLIVSNNCGNSASQEWTVSVYDYSADTLYETPYFEFKIENDNGETPDTLYICPGEEVKFRNHSGGYYGLEYLWDFGDSTFSSVFEPVKTYSLVGTYQVSLRLKDGCGRTSTPMNKWVTVSYSIMPKTDLSILPIQLCPGEEVYFFDNEFEPFKNYTYDIVFGDGQSQSNITQITNTDFYTFAIHKYDSVGNYNYTFTATNSCGNTDTLAGVIEVTTNLTDKRFVYIENSTNRDGEKPAEIWDQQSPDSSRFRLEIPIQWSSWDSTMNNTFFVYFWFGGVNLNGDPGSPDGMVQFTSNTIQYTDTVVAYIPYGPRGNTVGVLAAWYCDPMNIDMQEEPEAYTLPIHYDGYPIDEIPITKGGSASITDFTLGMPIMLPTWSGVCNSEKLDGRWLYTDSLGGSLIRVDLWDDEQNGLSYAVGYVDNPFGDYYYMIDEGTYYAITQDSIQLNSSGNSDCGTSSYGVYKLVRSGDSLQFVNGMDDCFSREYAMLGNLFMNIGNHHEDMSGCPGDPVKFKAAGGTSWTWNFGDGSSEVSGQQVVEHAYQDTGTYNAFVIVTGACGGADTVFTKVRIGNSNIPRADFDVMPYTSFTGDTVYFKYYDDDDFANESLIWNFGDGGTQNVRDPKHVYQYGGYYDVVLTVYNGCGAGSNWRSLEVIGESNPCTLFADFYYENYGDTAYFYDKSYYDLPPHRWQWAFGDGTFSDKVNPKHVYNQPGRYEVCLTVTDTLSGCVNKSCYEVQIGTFNCYTSFDYNVDHENNKVAFVDSSANVQKWFWSFGDGKYSEEKNPIHQYEKPGYYVVCLSTTATDGCESEWCEYVQVGSDSSFCFADLFAAPEDGNLKYKFWHESNFTPVNYYWDFGDGGVSKEKAPIHEYKESGVYEICLIIDNESGGCKAEICKEIKVGAINCYADFSFYVKNDTVEFKAKLDSTKEYKINWDFGDKTYGYTKNPVHKYYTAGVYKVCLSIKDASGCYAEVCKEIYVGTVDCKADFSFVKDNTTNTLKITDKSLGTITKWYWDFGDGKASNLKDPTHVYAKSGKYKVCLTILNDATKCYSEICKEIQIGVIDSVNCYFDFTYVVTGDTLELFGKSNTTISKVYWEFGDGSSNYGSTVSHMYSKSGVYKVCGNMVSASGCQVNVCKEIQVGEVDCKATFTYVVDHAAKKVELINQSIGEFTKWSWDMGDTKTMYGWDGSHTYDKYGKYKVCCIGTNTGTDCYSQICKEIEIIDSTKQLCKTSFAAVKTESSLEVKFADNSPVKYDKWYWTFGDGYNSSLKNPTHTYQKLGVYNVCLFGYSDSLKCGAEICKQISVTSSSTPVALLNAEFSHVVDSAGLGVQFKDLSTGTPSSWYWTFGDGTYAKGQQPGKHTYNKAGIYKVCLSVFSTATGELEISDYCTEVIVGTQECNVIAGFSSFVDITTSEVKFSDESKGSVNKWFWNFGNGKTSTSSNPIHTYSKAGYYLVSLAIQDTINGCLDYFADFVQVGSIDCKAEFEYTIDSLTVKFSNISKGSSDRVYWNFDDGTFSTDIDPIQTHTFKKPGKYLVTLSVASSGCSDIVRKQIEVGEVDCSAGYEVVTDSNKVANFTKDALGSVTNNFWVFGDGGFSHKESPVHKYKFPGYYTTALSTFYSSTNCIDYSEEVILIGSQGSDCEADFFYTIGDDNTVTFSNKSLGDGLTYKWYFGTGDTDSVAEPEYKYVNGGFYNVCLTAINSSNISNTTCKVIRVNPETTKDCLAKFEYSIDSTTRSVVFTDNSIGDPDTWSWSFGDGSSSTLQNPDHTYQSNDYYLVKFQISSSTTNCKSRTFAYLPVSVASSDYMKGAFNYEKDTAAAATKGSGEPVDFIGVATGKPAKYEWDFGDGSATSATSSPTHEYTESGTYEVCMVISDPVTGQSDTTCQNVEIDLGGEEPQNPVSVNEITSISGEVNVYPNPFVEHTEISYELRNTTLLTINVYDALGKKLETLVSTTKDAGSHTIIWNTDYLESGLYMLEFRDNNGYAKTMLVVKK